MRDLIHVLFMYFVYLMRFFNNIPTKTNTQNTYFRQAFALFFFYYKHNEPGLNRPTNSTKQCKRKKEAKQDEIQLQKNSNSRMHGRFSCHFVFTGNQ